MDPAAQHDADVVHVINGQSGFTPGEMPIEEQTSTYHVFDGLVRWGSLVVGCIVLMLAITFCTPLGFVTGAIFTLVLAGAGALFLKGKPTSAETH
ncbi:hypothetical protein BH09PSE2_BH09PSE2_06330 [soil metagenome]